MSMVYIRWKEFQPCRNSSRILFVSCGISKWIQWPVSNVLFVRLGAVCFICDGKSAATVMKFVDDRRRVGCWIIWASLGISMKKG